MTVGNGCLEFVLLRYSGASLVASVALRNRNPCKSHSGQPSELIQ